MLSVITAVTIILIYYCVLLADCTLIVLHDSSITAQSLYSINHTVVECNQLHLLKYCTQVQIWGTSIFLFPYISEENILLFTFSPISPPYYYFTD